VAKREERGGVSKQKPQRKSWRFGGYKANVAAWLAAKIAEISINRRNAIWHGGKPRSSGEKQLANQSAAQQKRGVKWHKRHEKPL